MLLYGGILYAYMGRILVQWELPKGWVSFLILAFSVAGIFALLLIHPIREAAENTWIRTFARWFYRALFPLLGLLAVAIYTRVQQYGITEERYSVLVLAAWLALIATYFLLRQGRGIIWIPASLAVVALLSVVGPWSAFAVAQRSQHRQLLALSQQYQLLQNGKLDNAGKHQTKLPWEVRKRTSSIFDFFADRNALAQLQPQFSASLQLPDSIRQQPRWKQQQWVSDRLFAASQLFRVDRADEHSGTVPQVSTTFRTEEPKVQPLGRGRYWLPTIATLDYRNLSDDTTEHLLLREGTFRLRSTQYRRRLVLEQLRPDGQWQPVLAAEPGAFVDSLARQHPGENKEEENESIRLPATGMTLTASGKGATLRLFVRYINRTDRQDTVKYEYDGNGLLEFVE
ncbi:DUF4153 domain-containing protein [Hymenobacter elongatus]|uniref:DUF4153 domain-containing protein n=2 Tax=Hymenobacter elongatus TaxID=877208 RepID=A0A4Z0PJA0_9BACT|nr:DUF4153 domain-containing protein [Hymenobacter elongatus]